MKTIAVFGGSYNPPHEGHFKMAQFIHESLGVDEVWLMFSVNPFKEPGKYPALHHRLAMGDLIKKHYSETPIVLSDFEELVHLHGTYAVMSKLREKYPGDRFVWVMGADNLATFHTWEKWENILDEFPIAVVERPPYGGMAEKSVAALTYAHARQEDPKAIVETGHGWTYLKGPLFDISSTHLLEEIRAGRMQFDGPFQEVADYIREHKLYGVADAAFTAQNDYAKPAPCPQAP